MDKNIFITGLVCFLVVVSCSKDNDDTQNVLNYNIDIATTLTADHEWFVEGYVSVNADLIIEPGTILRFKEDASLHIGNSEYGSLRAVGTADDPIIFTSASKNPQAGDWNGVYFYDKNSSTASELTYCIFEYGGISSDYEDQDAVLEIYDTDLKVTHCTFRNLQNCGIYLNEYAEFVAFNNNLIENCGKHLMVMPATAAGTIGADNNFVTNENYGILVTYSAISQNVTWSRQSVPYFVDNWIYVNGNNAGLNIEAGTTLKFMPQGALIIGDESNGRFVASGLADLPITFTSAAFMPSKGDWQFIRFHQFTTAGSSMNYCIVEYGAGDTSDDEDAVVEIYTSNIAITNCTIRHNEGYGIYIGYDVNPTVTGNIFEDNNNDDIYKEE